MRTVIMSVHFYRTTGCHIRKTTFLIPSWEPQTSLTNSMEQSPFWEATQEIPRVLCNPKVHYRIYKSPPPVPILSHINPVHASPSLFLIIIFNIILLPTIRSSKSSLSFGFPHQNPVCMSPIRATWPAHLILLDLITWMIFDEEYRA